MEEQRIRQNMERITREKKEKEVAKKKVMEQIAKDKSIKTGQTVTAEDLENAAPKTIPEKFQ